MLLYFFLRQSVCSNLSHEGKSNTYLKEECAVALQSDTFSISQCKQPIVVHDRVHILDPKRVDVAVKDEVLPLVLVRRSVDVSENVRQKSVGPVPRVRVQDSVQFHYAAILRVDSVQLRCQTQPSTTVTTHQTVARHKI